MSCAYSDRVALHALQSLPASDRSAVEAHLAQCAACRVEMEALRPVVDSFVAWPRDVLRPTAPLWDRVAHRIAGETANETPAAARDDVGNDGGNDGWNESWNEPAWTEAAPGLWYQLLSADPATDRVTMLVRLEPGASYPSHVHAGLEEVHLLHGELCIDDRKLHAGDHNRAEAGSVDTRIWSETGCTCLLVTSHRDALK